MIHIREDIVNLLPANSVGIELGVFEGEFSQVLLDSGKFKELHLVDIFGGATQSGDKHGENVRIVSGQKLLQIVKARFVDSPTVHIHIADSVNFLSNCNSKSADFIYIDTVHQYDITERELQQSLRVIKPGGLLCGHDYDEVAFKGCYDAVNDFAKKNGLEFITTTQDKLASYVFKIPK